MSKDFEERKKRRTDSYRELAEKARTRAAAHRKASDDAVAGIPLGQPILIGHHSERRHRRDLARSHHHMDRSIQEQDKAEYYERRARAAENNSAISSDDPEAIEKLKAKIKKMEEQREKFKEINRDFRKCGGDVDKMTTIGDKAKANLKETLADERNFDKKPVPSYMFSNLGQNIRAAKNRLQRLEAQKDQSTQVFDFAGGRIVDNVEDNRVQVFFDSIPPVEVRTKLKQRGFRWARSIGCWQRHKSSLALYLAKEIVGIKDE